VTEFKTGFLASSETWPVRDVEMAGKAIASASPEKRAAAGGIAERSFPSCPELFPETFPADSRLVWLSVPAARPCGTAVTSEPFRGANDSVPLTPIDLSTDVL
jgi:hypothetical protein